MTIDSADVTKQIANVEHFINNEQDLSPTSKAMFQTLLMIIKLLCNRLNLNSSNSSKPPSSDPNRKKPKKESSGKPRGGQKGHNGTTLRPVEEPDVIKFISIDKGTLPPGNYHENGHQARQVMDIKISLEVTEYQAQILMNEKGRQFVAPFPPGVNRSIQYGTSLKAHSVYLSSYQLIPYDRIQTQFNDQYGINLSTGSINNFNREAANLLEDFEKAAITQLIQSNLVHADETGINIDGKRLWLHGASNSHWTWLAAHEKRGSEAMEQIGIIPHFKGVLCHDHWKPYYKYSCCIHALCNAHHLRELTRAWEQDDQQWAKELNDLLKKMNIAVQESGGALPPNKAKFWRDQYRQILKKADKECPPPKEPEGRKTGGKLKRSKARNLLERLRDYEGDTLRFVENRFVPFTNNQGERDIRMIKVQQKISGCFRSMEGARTHCIVRSYLSTCQKNGIGGAEALETLFQGKLPKFIQDVVEQISVQAE